MYKEAASYLSQEPKLSDKYEASNSKVPGERVASQDGYASVVEMVESLGSQSGAQVSD